jgi:putative membrane protein
VSEGASGLSDGLHQYRDGLKEGADQADQLAGTKPDLDGLVKAGIMTEAEADQARAEMCPTGTPDQVCKGIEQAYAQGLLNGTSGGLNTAVDGLEQEKDGSSLLGGADELADGASELSDGVTKFVKDSGTASGS